MISSVMNKQSDQDYNFHSVCNPVTSANDCVMSKTSLVLMNTERTGVAQLSTVTYIGSVVVVGCLVIAASNFRFWSVYVNCL